MQYPAPGRTPTSYGDSAFTSSSPNSRSSRAQTASGGVAPHDRGSTQSLVRCDTCGRSFNPESIDRHRNICERVFNKKRKAFDSVASRLGDLENASHLIRNAKKIEQEKAMSSSSSSKKQQKDGKALPKWKQQSLQFRQAILAAKADAGDRESQVKAEKLQRQLNAAGGDEPGMQKCPHCDRTFNKIAAERHIPICQKTFGSKPGGGRLLKGGGRLMQTANDPQSGPQTGQASCETARVSVPSPTGRNGSTHLAINAVSNGTTNAMARKHSTTPTSTTRSRSGSVQTPSGRRDIGSSGRPHLGGAHTLVR